MSELWLVRHGSTAWTGRRWCGTTDLPLDATGRRQAASLARALAGMLAVPVTLIASPQARAIQTAEKVAKSLRCDYRVDPRLREIDFGVAEGLSWDELERDLPGVAVEILGGATVIGWPGAKRAWVYDAGLRMSGRSWKTSVRQRGARDARRVHPRTARDA